MSEGKKIWYLQNMSIISPMDTTLKILREKIDTLDAQLIASV
jgi:hypothetical protein